MGIWEVASLFSQSENVYEAVFPMEMNKVATNFPCNAGNLRVPVCGRALKRLARSKTEL